MNTGNPAETGVKLMENEIDYNESLHTKQMQNSKYVKIDDNLLNFYLDSNKRTDASKATALKDSDIKTLRNELNKVHIKYLNED
jgi:hypothetical protein